MDEKKITTVWTEYKRIVQYLKFKNMYENTREAYEYYHGNSWDRAETGDVKMVNFNIVKPIVKYKVGIVNSNSYQVVYIPTNFESADKQEAMTMLCKQLNNHHNRMWEQEQIERKVRRAVKASCITSEGILYKYNEEVDGKNYIRTEYINKNNICYGNENTDDIQDQPFIIISFRRPVEMVKEEARLNEISEEDINLILPDSEVEEQEGVDSSINEIVPMCLVLLKLYKKNGTVHSVKVTEQVEIQKETDHKLKLYPVAHIVWEDREGDSRGEGAVTSIGGNQYEVNRTAMRRIISVKMAAYPRLAVNTDKLVNPDALNKIGAPIKFSGNSIDDVSKQIGYLIPASMSSDSKVLQEELISNTRELEGASEINTGTINPEQASGRAILAVQQAAQQPLNEQVFKLKVFLEDLARIDFDILQTYETNGMIVLIDVPQEDGTVKSEPYKIPKEVLDSFRGNITVEITPKTPYDKFARETSLENLLVQGKISFDEYVMSLDDDSAMPKDKLDKILQKRAENRIQIEKMQEEALKIQQLVNNKVNVAQDDIDSSIPQEVSK